MKLLRILTGRHAGARLRLKHQSYRISADDDADVQVTDWRHDPVTLQLEEGQTLMPAIAANTTNDEGPLAALGDAASAAVERLLDFVPRSFGDVVLCVGPADSPWPSDMELLSRLMRPAPPDAVQPTAEPRGRASTARSRRAVIAGLLGSTVMLGAFAAVVLRTSNTAQASHPKPSLQGRVWRAIEAAHISGIVVKPVGSQVVVEGLLPDPDMQGRLRAALQPFAAEPLVHRYASATDIARSIDEAMNNAGLRTSYQGQGVFVVSGGALSLDKVREAAHRVAADLSPLVQRIDVAVKELPPPERVPIGAMLTSDDLQYVQTRDGTKHLSIPAAPIRVLPEPAHTYPPADTPPSGASHGPSAGEQRVQ